MSTNPPSLPSAETAGSRGVSPKGPEGRPVSSLGPEPKSSLWWTLTGWVVFGALVAGGWYYRDPLQKKFESLTASKKAPPEKAKRIAPVSTAKARKRDMPLYLNGLGTVTAFKTVTVRSRVEGELISIAFTEGQMVKEGDLLAEIDPRQFEVLLAQAEGQLARDQATLKTAKATLSRYEGLLASKSIAAQQVDDQATLVQQTMASIQTDEAAVANAQLQLTYCRITAPISGRIGLRLVDQGNMVRANEPSGLAVITQLQPIALTFTIPQDDVSRVLRRFDPEKPLPVGAFDRDFKQSLADGTLLAIDNQVDAATGTVRLKAKFPNDDGMLFPNQFVNARLLVDTRSNAIVVPSAAVQRGPTSMYVYVVKADNTVELRNVVPGPAEGGETAIDSGLEEDEVVVTDGLDKLQPGATVAPREKGKDAGADKKGSTGDSAKPATDHKPSSDPPPRKPSTEPGPAPATANKSAPSNSTPESEKEPKPRPSVSCGDLETDSDAKSEESP